jgi:raffinose/stachyose/melibiose transport system permease protein
MRHHKTLGNAGWQALFLGPALACFGLIVVVPFFMGFYYAFTKWNGVSDVVTFNGLTNFQALLADGNYLGSFAFTALFTVFVVVLGNLLAFALAWLLTQALKARNLFRAVFFIPNVISGFFLGFIWQFIFIKVFANIGGMVDFFIFNLPWLGTRETGFAAMVIVQLWQISGYLMVIYIAGITAVPKELLESATIDGAGHWSTLRNVTLPMIMPAITVSVFLSINTAFKVFDINYSLTSGNFDTRSVALDIYREGFTAFNYGLGAAKALVFFLVVAAITIVQTSLTKRREVAA